MAKEFYSSDLIAESKSPFSIDTGISQNAKDFNRSLLGIVTALDAEVSTVIMKAVIDLYKKIAIRTPVDKGRARASWQVSTEFDSNIQEEESFDESPQGKAQRGMDSVNANIQDFGFSLHNKKIFIYNNLEYIEFLEKGHSKQAGSGMVGISLSEFDVKFQEALRESRLVS